MEPKSTFRITRVDLDLDQALIVDNALLIGSTPECNLWLNHPAVAPRQATVSRIGDVFHLRNHDQSRAVKINDKLIEADNYPLAASDVMELGPFHLKLIRTEEGLDVQVSRKLDFEDDEEQEHQEVSTMASTGLKGAEPKEEQPATGQKKDTTVKQPVSAPKTTPAIKKTIATHKVHKKRGQELDDTKVLDIWFARIDERSKMAQPSRLNPFDPKLKGDKKYGWKTTSDLSPRRAFSLPKWILAAVFLVGTLLLVASYRFASSSFSPALLSVAHTRTQMDLTLPIARKPNGDSCLSCHSSDASMDQNCTSCHQASAFVANVTEEHQQAGIGCIVCHAEHRGADFQPAKESLLICAKCHNDGNRNTYNGRVVHAPHNGTFGYPVINGEWVWKGLTAEEWQLKKIKAKREDVDSEEKWRSKQFHALHFERVSAVANLARRKDGSLGCSSCHNNFRPIDRDTPRRTCALCHLLNKEVIGETAASTDAPDCNSCHTQHVLDQRHRSPLLLTSRSSTN